MGSKLISLLLVVVFTHHLNPQEYGEVELISVIINLCLPFVTLSIYDAVLRFVMKDNEDQGSVLRNGLAICALVGLVFLSGSVIGILFFWLRNEYARDSCDYFRSVHQSGVRSICPWNRAHQALRHKWIAYRDFNFFRL